MAKFEGQHKGEFLISEGNGEISREAVVVASGQALLDGMVVEYDGNGRIVRSNDPGASDDVAGILYGDVNASASHPDGAAHRPGVIIARLAEVDERLITYPEANSDSDSDGEAALHTRRELAKLNIIVRMRS